MAKQTCWFGWVKRIFVFEAKPKEEKKSKKWRWTFGRLKIIKQEYPALGAPERLISEVTEEQRQHALNVAVATAAAAEAAVAAARAAVAAARAAAEVVRLTGGSSYNHLIKKKDPNLAATTIQSAFRAHLARKALRALKGLVKLQAIVRGRAVRRKTSHKIKHFPSITVMQSEVQKRSIPFDYGNCKDIEKKLFVRPIKELGEKEMKHDCNSPRCWDSSTLSKEDMGTIWLKKQEAITRRERMKQYSFSHRERRNYQMLEESASSKENGRSYWLEQCADTEGHNRDGPETLKSGVHSKKIASETCGATQIAIRNVHKQDLVQGLYTPYSFPRRSFCHGKQNLAAEEESSMPNSPVLPTYMAVTESARAKLRSMSTPKQRLGYLDTLSDHNFRYKHGLSFSSYNCDSPKFGGTSQQISVSMNQVH